MRANNDNEALMGTAVATLAVGEIIEIKVVISMCKGLVFFSVGNYLLRALAKPTVNVKTYLQYTPVTHPALKAREYAPLSVHH